MYDCWKFFRLELHLTTPNQCCEIWNKLVLNMGGNSRNSLDRFYFILFLITAFLLASQEVLSNSKCALFGLFKGLKPLLCVNMFLFLICFNFLTLSDFFFTAWIASVVQAPWHYWSEKWYKLINESAKLFVRIH